MKKLNNKKGFTIVELVIVIAVIGILAGVLIPTFSGIVGNANTKAALSDVRAVLTNALNMSSTAQLAGKTTDEKYQTVFIMNYTKKSENAPEYAYGYNGNELVALNISYGENNNEKMKAEGLDLDIVNSVLLSSKAIKESPTGEGENQQPTYTLDSLTESILKKTYNVTNITVDKSEDVFTIKLENGTELTAYTSVDLPLHIVVLTKFGA